jgi:hypothetical protein
VGTSWFEATVLPPPDISGAGDLYNSGLLSNNSCRLSQILGRSHFLFLRRFRTPPMFGGGAAIITAGDASCVSGCISLDHSLAL